MLALSGGIRFCFDDCAEAQRHSAVYLCGFLLGETVRFATATASCKTLTDWFAGADRDVLGQLLVTPSDSGRLPSLRLFSIRMISSPARASVCFLPACCHFRGFTRERRIFISWPDCAARCRDYSRRFPDDGRA